MTAERALCERAGPAAMLVPTRMASLWGSAFEQRTVGVASNAGTIQPGEDSAMRLQPSASPAPEMHSREWGRKATALSRSGIDWRGEQE